MEGVPENIVCGIRNSDKGCLRPIEIASYVSRVNPEMSLAQAAHACR
jgi:hypothetical protein